MLVQCYNEENLPIRGHQGLPDGHLSHGTGQLQDFAGLFQGEILKNPVVKVHKWVGIGKAKRT